MFGISYAGCMSQTPSWAGRRFKPWTPAEPLKSERYAGGGFQSWTPSGGLPGQVLLMYFFAAIAQIRTHLSQLEILNLLLSKKKELISKQILNEHMGRRNRAEVMQIHSGRLFSALCSLECLCRLGSVCSWRKANRAGLRRRGTSK